MGAFIPEAWKDDGTYDENSWPSDAILATDDEVQIYRGNNPPDGKILGSIAGRPAWVNAPAPVLTAGQIRAQRDQLLDQYDRGVSMVQRAIRMTVSSDTERLDYLNSKLVELDTYATDLQNIPTDSGFPESVTWPTMPIP